MSEQVLGPENTSPHIWEVYVAMLALSLVLFVMQLSDRHPHLSAAELVPRFVPPPRFDDVRLANYRPDERYPSQATALHRIESFADALTVTVPVAIGSKTNRWRARAQHAMSKYSRSAITTQQNRALYLDGGFGVGKTHLLAGLWHASPEPKSYVTFGELTAFIGFVGMAPATKAFAGLRLLCIDEFELDDVANTLMVVSFLRAAVGAGLRLAVTSNTVPESLGEQRFSASEFRREIAAIASYFDEQRIDGDDYRAHVTTLPLAQHQNDVEHVSRDDFTELLGHLRRVQPVQYGAMLEGIGAVVITGTHTLENQDDALLFVQLVDKLYDARIPVRIDGCSVEDVFSAAYRKGGYRKKYGRAESRLSAMQAESKGIL